jgi:hypothetical protein
VSYDVVSAYTLVVGDETGPPVVSVHGSAHAAWRELDREVRSRSRMRPRPRRAVDEESATRLANAWRTADPDSRFWNVTAHRLPILLPVIARNAQAASAR